MNTLRTAVNTYVAMRRGLGYKLRDLEKRLTDFALFMEQHGATIVTSKLAVEWATSLPGRQASWTLRLSDVRGFARYLSSIEPRTEVPPTGLLPGLSRANPYLYTETEITKLLEAALQLSPPNGLRRWTYYCLFGLLAVSGLRISEALMLRREDVDLEEGVLKVVSTKFGKSRLVPIHATTQQVLTDYARRRDSLLWPPRSPYFFVAEQGGRLLLQYVHRVFWNLSQQTGLRGSKDHTGPRIHDFRHRFAVETLLSWYRAEKNPHLLLPVLSTYLGHSNVRDTYWYLSACPALLGQAVRRLETRWGRQS
jgi:integrase